MSWACSACWLCRPGRAKARAASGGQCAGRALLSICACEQALRAWADASTAPSRRRKVTLLTERTAAPSKRWP